MKSFARVAICLALFPFLAHSQSRWLPYGPDGGDARSFASDPYDHNHLYLGTVSGTIYDTHDGGQTWARLARVGKRDDLVLDNIVVDPAKPNHLFVGGWVLDHADGGLYASTDGGKTWTANTQMQGHSIRALTVAPSDPKILIVGALDGVFRSTDAGATWALISPAGSNELHEIESIAIDPKNPLTIYAGTWHLPWKTTDGGQTWHNMKEGIIDDSDVFSIIIDPTNAENVYLSACSGIYRSTDQGARFSKVQGMPFSARRTRVLMEDSAQPNTVFAGTTEGLWRTTDSGRSFVRNGDPAWIINDVNIDPQNSKHILLATDRTGVLMSNDGGLSFTPSNRGFSSRQVSTLAQDRNDAARLYAGVINDKTAGGVFASTDGGVSWLQKSMGLNGADIFSLGQTPAGTLLAGTRHGIYRLQGDTWQNSGLTLALPSEPSAVADRPKAPVGKGTAARRRSDSNPALKGRTTTRTSSASSVSGAKRDASTSTAPTRNAPPQQSNTGVYAFAANDAAVFAATDEGLLVSTNEGGTWNRIRSASTQPWRLVSTQGSHVFVANMKSIAMSTDRGTTFTPISGPAELTSISSLTVDDAGHIWLGGREGVYVSENSGQSWHTVRDLFVPDTSGLFFDRAGSRVLVTSNAPGTLVFAVHLPDMKVNYWESGWVLRQVRPVGDHLVGVTPYDGVVLEPKMVVSQEVPLRTR